MTPTQFKILTKEEADNLFSIPDESTNKPDFFDDNSDKWVDWMYENSFRIVFIGRETEVQH